jgi:hypothetical protein
MMTMISRSDHDDDLLRCLITCVCSCVVLQTLCGERDRVAREQAEVERDLPPPGATKDFADKKREL